VVDLERDIALLDAATGRADDLAVAVTSTMPCSPMWFW
jgi:hypothetical protein